MQMFGTLLCTLLALGCSSPRSYAKRAPVSRTDQLEAERRQMLSDINVIERELTLLMDEIEQLASTRTNGEVYIRLTDYILGLLRGQLEGRARDHLAGSVVQGGSSTLGTIAHRTNTVGKAADVAFGVVRTYQEISLARLKISQRITLDQLRTKVRESSLRLEEIKGMIQVQSRLRAELDLALSELRREEAEDRELERLLNEHLRSSPPLRRRNENR